FHVRRDRSIVLDNVSCLLRLLQCCNYHILVCVLGVIRITVTSFTLVYSFAIMLFIFCFFFFFQAEDGIRDWSVTGVQTCALPIFESLVEDRFYGRLKLLMTTPISRTSYVLGILGYDYMLGLMTSSGFILVSYLFEIEVQLNLLDVIILVLLTLSSFTGISIIVSQQAENLH